jgi:hypothetical protein
MEQYSNPLTRQIYDILLPLLGSLMASSAIRLQAKKAGTTEQDISRQHLQVIAVEIEKALRIFVGTDKACEVATQIKNLI